MKIFLTINAYMWVVLGILCTALPYWTAELSGYSLIGAQGPVEFLAVYGGIEIGLGIFYWLALKNKVPLESAVLFSAALYGSIVLCRIIGIARYGFDIGMALLYFSVELSMCVASFFLLQSLQRRSV